MIDKSFTQFSFRNFRLAMAKGLNHLPDELIQQAIEELL